MIREIARKTDRMQVHKKYKNIVMFLTWQPSWSSYK